MAVHCNSSHFPIYLNLSSSPCPQINPQIRPISISPNQFTITRNQRILRWSGSGNGGDPVQEPSFFDENGAVQDMDDYLNYLSLEYDSVWDTKPSW